MGERSGAVTQEEFLSMPGEDAALLVAARFETLRALGCSADAAVVVAFHPEITIDDALELIRSGCDGRTALRILL